MISNSFVRENRPLLNFHESARQEAGTAICFHYMRICGLNHVVLPEEELDLARRMSERKQRN
jgi:hypothetical protein